MTMMNMETGMRRGRRTGRDGNGRRRRSYRRSWDQSSMTMNVYCEPPPQVEYFLGELRSNTGGELRSVMSIAGVALAATTNAFDGVNNKGGVGEGGM